MSETYNLFTLRATSRFKFWWILKFLEIVFICAVINVHLGFKFIAAFFAGFPIAGMSFVEMMTA